MSTCTWFEWMCLRRSNAAEDFVFYLHLTQIFRLAQTEHWWDLVELWLSGTVSGQTAAGAGAEGNESARLSSAALVQITAPLSHCRCAFCRVCCRLSKRKASERKKKARAPSSRSVRQTAAVIRSELGAASDWKDGKCSFSLVAVSFSHCHIKVVITE